MRRSHNNPARFLLVEDDNERAAYMLGILAGDPWPPERPRPHIIRRHNSGTALRYLQHVANGVEPMPDAIFLDFDIDFYGGGGDRVAAAIIPMGYPGVLVIHSANPVGGPLMRRVLEDAGYRVLYAPITDRASPRTWRQLALMV